MKSLSYTIINWIDWLKYGEERSFTEGLSKQTVCLFVIVSGTRTPYGQNSEKRNITHGAIRKEELSGKQTEKKDTFFFCLFFYFRLFHGNRERRSQRREKFLIYDVIILGAGPAGLSAGLYAARAKMQTLIFEKSVVGGQIATTHEVENYPGSPENSTGPSLVERMKEQALTFGAELVSAEITKVDFSGKEKKVFVGEQEYTAKSVIVACGATPKQIGCEGEDEFRGRGVCYCATCDGPFFEDKHIVVVGGGDTAVEESLYLSKIAKRVTIIHRRDALRAAKSIQEKAFANEKIDFLWNSVITKIEGQGPVQRIHLENTVTKETSIMEADPDDGVLGIFVLVGFNPETQLVEGLIDTENGYIITDAEMRTSQEGVFAAGDIRKKSLRQVVTATADGAIAAVSAEKYVEALAE